MSALSNYLQNNLIDFIFRGVSFTPPNPLYIALCTENPVPADDGLTIAEVSGGNYTRQSISTGQYYWYSTQGNTAEFSTGTTGSTGNTSSVAWGGATWTADVVAIAICDASIGGNLLFFSTLTDSVSVSVTSPLTTITFSNNALKPSFS